MGHHKDCYGYTLKATEEDVNVNEKTVPGGRETNLP